MENYSVHVKAIFRGKDGSCGYKKNTEYKLSIRQDSGSLISIINRDGGGECEYASILTFLHNWDDIRH